MYINIPIQCSQSSMIFTTSSGGHVSRRLPLAKYLRSVVDVLFSLCSLYPLRHDSSHSERCSGVTSCYSYDLDQGVFRPSFYQQDSSAGNWQANRCWHTVCPCIAGVRTSSLTGLHCNPATEQASHSFGRSVLTEGLVVPNSSSR